MSIQNKLQNITMSQNKPYGPGPFKEKLNISLQKEGIEDIPSQIPTNIKKNPSKKSSMLVFYLKKQQGDLDRQIEFMQSKYPGYRLVSDIGSGINFKRKGFKTILEGLFKGAIKEVVVTKRQIHTIWL